MAKNNLINQNIWAEYSKKVQDSMNNPRNMGEITEEQAKKLLVQDCKKAIKRMISAMKK